MHVHAWPVCKLLHKQCANTASHSPLAETWQLEYACTLHMLHRSARLSLRGSATILVHVCAKQCLSLICTCVGVKGRNLDADNHHSLRTFKIYWRLYIYNPGQGTFEPVPGMPRHLPRQIRRALESLHLINTAGAATGCRLLSSSTCIFELDWAASSTFQCTIHHHHSTLCKSLDVDALHADHQHLKTRFECCNTVLC